MKIDMSSSKAFIADATKVIINTNDYYREQIGIENMENYNSIHQAAMAYENDAWKSRGFKVSAVYNGVTPNTVKVILEKVGAAKYCLAHLPNCSKCGESPRVSCIDEETGFLIAPTFFIDCECGTGEFNSWVDAVYWWLNKHVDKKGRKK